jgi:hypothetical protein
VSMLSGPDLSLMALPLLPGHDLPHEPHLTSAPAAPQRFIPERLELPLERPVENRWQQGVQL